MELFKIPEGKGQKVYIDPDWLKATDELGFILIPDNVETPGRKARKELLDYLLSLGYDVVTDSSKTDESTFFFSPCTDLHINKTVDEYEKKKQDKIHESLEETNVHEPLTLPFPEEGFPKTIPGLPFMLKNIKEDGGVDKILIESPKQLKKFKVFYEKINDYSFAQSVKKVKKQFGLGPDVVFKEDGTSNSGICFSRIDYKERLKDDFVMQEFIPTPTQYNTSLRVITSSSGDILCASLKYSEPASNVDDAKYGLVDRYLCDPKSPFYIGSVNVTSNTVGGGNSILLGKEAEDYSIIEKRLLLMHGIFPKNATVPEDVIKAASSIAVNCRRELGAISGMDFIFDSRTQEWKYLEQQEYPMMYTYCEAFGLPYVTDITKDYNGFIRTQFSADIDSRLRALSLAMMKKKGYTK